MSALVSCGCFYSLFLLYRNVSINPFTKVAQLVYLDQEKCHPEFKIQSNLYIKKDPLDPFGGIQNTFIDFFL